MTDTADALFKRFASYLELSERSLLTIKNYLSDLRGFAKWFEATNGDALTPDKITPIGVYIVTEQFWSIPAIDLSNVWKKTPIITDFLHILWK